MQRIIILLFVILSLTLPAHAESRYVTDQILVALRPAQDDTAPPPRIPGDRYTCRSG
jgi:hypothetical protein